LRALLVLWSMALVLSLWGDVMLLAEPAGDDRLAVKWSSSDVVLLDEIEECGEDSERGSSTKQGGWWWLCCLAGDDAAEAVALRISFSVCVRCSSSLSRSLSDCSDEVVLVSWWSLASRSRTWRSLRSRKARCLRKISALLIGN
jgi:hypothetical protein